MNDQNDGTPGIILDAAQGVPATLGDLVPDRLYLLPLTARPFFPAQTVPIVTNEANWRGTLERAGDSPQHMIGLVYSGTTPGSVPEAKDFAAVGTVVRMHHPGTGNGKVHFIAEGIRRFRIRSWLTTKPPFLVQVEYPEQPIESSDEIKAYALAIINMIRELLPLNPLYKEQLKAFLERFNVEDASPLADFAAILTSATSQELQQVLETFPLLPRMEQVLGLLQKELEVAGMQAKIRQKVEESISEQQRKFFLREQMKEIQKELGISKDDKTVELERFRGRIGVLSLPEHARARIEEEMQKLSFLELGSPEYAVTRNYLDALTALPWGRTSDDVLDLKRARRILDRDHAGLKDVKERIIEFLAVGALKGEIAGSIILLVGPPGVGKSSVGRSIAEALGRRFYRFSVGGMRDEAEIKGHRRTYIGAMPGKFIQALRDAGTSNPVIMLDEIDKIGASYQGDPASALLEALDPEQNRDFLDHYLDVRFDLSKVLFICTANQLDTIPAPLLDRMEVIRLAGYIAEEKLGIARKYLWPRLLERAGVRSGQLAIDDAALRVVVEGYAREAGVRNLEKQLARIVRKSAVRLLDRPGKGIRITPGDIVPLLGQPRFRPEAPARGVGVVTGLAWTAMGGATLNVEATRVHTKARGFKLTGMLGSVMKESAEIAYSYVASNPGLFPDDEHFFDDAFVHLHVPEGATPKDGPSAGITMATALVSLARGEPIARPLAMTGELTLTGQVLAVGGIREKVVAARRAGLKQILLPAANRRDFDELPAHLRKGLKAHFVDHYHEVARLVSSKRGLPRRRAALRR
ncbi:MAG: Lon protease [Gammaproteobacteria bacterium]|nr:Lon protease [Gammaproteobacteria bacterium]